MKRFVSLILSVCFLFSINTVSYAANISSRKASNPVIQSMNDKYHVDFSGMSMLDTPRFCRNRVRTLCLPWDALDWYSRNAAFIARRTVRADSLVVEIIMLNDLAHPRERRAWTARESP